MNSIYEWNDYGFPEPYGPEWNALDEITPEPALEPRKVRKILATSTSQDFLLQSVPSHAAVCYMADVRVDDTIHLAISINGALGVNGVYYYQYPRACRGVVGLKAVQLCLKLLPGPHRRDVYIIGVHVAAVNALDAKHIRRKDTRKETEKTIRTLRRSVHDVTLINHPDRYHITGCKILKATLDRYVLSM